MWIHKQWANLIGAQHGITTSHMVAAGLIGAHAFLRTSPAYRNVQGKLVAGIGAVVLTYISAAVPNRQKAMQLPPYVPQTH